MFVYFQPRPFNRPASIVSLLRSLINGRALTYNRCMEADSKMSILARASVICAKAIVYTLIIIYDVNRPETFTDIQRITHKIS